MDFLIQGGAVNGIVELFKLFKEFFNFPVPLGVILLCMIALTYMFVVLQKNRREDYKIAQDGNKETIEVLTKALESREARIKELESILFTNGGSKRTN